MGLFLIILSIIILAYSFISREVRIHKEKKKFYGYTKNEMHSQWFGWISFILGIIFQLN